jgi:hypothetical protein
VPKKYHKRQYIRRTCLYFWAYTQFFLAIASGATPIGSVDRAPDKKKSTERRWRDWSLWSATYTHPYPRGLLTSGALVVHPMIKDQLVDKWYRRNRLPFVDNELRLHCQQNKDQLLPSGVIYESLKKNKLKYFAHSNSQTRLWHMILELHHCDKTRMPWLKYIVKVRPQDPSCVIWYTHMNALC